MRLYVRYFVRLKMYVVILMYCTKFHLNILSGQPSVTCVCSLLPSLFLTSMTVMELRLRFKEVVFRQGGWIRGDQSFTPSLLIEMGLKKNEKRLFCFGFDIENLVAGYVLVFWEDAGDEEGGRNEMEKKWQIQDGRTGQSSASLPEMEQL